MLPTFFLIALGLFGATNGYSQENCMDGRTVIVHLFNWNWNSIARECEIFLGPKGFCGVQVSPPNEHIVFDWHPWWERYQPISYQIESVSGSRGEFQDMVNRCRAQGVLIYVDAVINHMAGAGQSGQGSGGSGFDSGALNFPDFGPDDFNCCQCGACDSGDCNIGDYGNVNQVRNCRLESLVDLALGKPYPREKVASFLRDLTNMGVAGFRVDACKHMWPGDLEAIYGQAFQGGSPFIFNEVIDKGGEPIGAREYTHLGKVTEFRFCDRMYDIFKQGTQLKDLRNFGESWGMLSDYDAFVFVDNHDNQRGHGGAGSTITYKDPWAYKLAVSYMLAWPYGFTRLMSSFYFDDRDMGPPMYGGRVGDSLNGDGSCANGWVCEHRWRQIANMVQFRNYAKGQPVSNWWDNGGNQIAFSRGNKAFFAISKGESINENLQTGLPEGSYCDVISGDPTDGGCTGKTVYVGGDGRASIQVDGGEDSMLAIHEGSRSGSGGAPPPPSNPGNPDPPSNPNPNPLPPPSGTSRTVIFIKANTMPGQDLFIRGGISHDRRSGCSENAATSPCAIPITYNKAGDTPHYDQYNSWQVGDTKLDWYGREASQGDYRGRPAEGSPLVWTSSSQGSPGYQPLNQWGDHYWMIDVNMDCDATEGGWFELKAFMSGGSGWERDVTQGSCTGSSAATAPFSSNNHIAFCGKVNVFNFSSGSCTIDNL